MTPLPPGALQRVLQSLPPERPDPFEYRSSLSPEALLQRRAEIAGILKTLEIERQAIDEELSQDYSPAELRMGVRAPGGWIPQQRSRTSWDYPAEVREALKDLQKQAQHDGKAQPLRSTFLCLDQQRD